MQKKYIVPFIPLLCVLSLAGCNNTNDDYSIKSFVTKTPETFVYTTSGSTPTIGIEKEFSGNIPIHLINDNSIPYLSIKTAVDVCYLNPMAKHLPDIHTSYSYETKDNKTTITNKCNNATCVIDYNKQTIEFTDREAFINNDLHQVTPLDKGLGGGREYFKEVEKIKYVAPKTPLIIDLKKYDIPIFCKDNEGYIPNEVFANILTLRPTMKLTYVNGSLYMSQETGPAASGKDNRITLNKVVDAKFSLDYMKYCYNLNALTLDVNYGLRERKSRAINGYTINYKIDGYANMNKYGKEKFLSNEPNVANQALLDVINNEYDDGGHTIYTDVGFLENKTPTINYGIESNAYMKIYPGLIKARIEAGYNPTKTTGNNNAIGDFKIFPDSKGIEDTAFLTMDSFAAPSGDYKTLDYCTNTMSLVHYANNQLRTEKGKKIKYLFVDLSVNGGGASTTECFMSSWLSRGKSHFKTCSYLTGAFSDFTYKADVNGDGVISELDFLPTTIEKLFVIISPCSFSCGNLLPTDLQSYSNAIFVGSRSGGGACITRPGLQTGYGSAYQLSSTTALCLKDADENNLVSNDSGVEVTNENGIPLPTSSPNLYFDRSMMFDLLHPLNK